MVRTAIIVAGGSGQRMGADIPKQFLPLAGEPILLHTVRRFLATKLQQLVLVLPTAYHSHWASIAQAALSDDEALRLHVCAGGATRTLSVQAGLQALVSQVVQPSQCLVAIHDGVRPFVSGSLLERAFQMTIQKGAAVVCVPVKASLRKESSPGNSEAVDRSRFYEVQTPQVFFLDRILAAYTRRSHDQFTDDASLYESTGASVSISPGSYDNIKITTPEDLSVAENILLRWEA